MFVNTAAKNIYLEIDTNIEEALEECKREYYGTGDTVEQIESFVKKFELESESMNLLINGTCYQSQIYMTFKFMP